MQRQKNANFKGKFVFVSLSSVHVSIYVGSFCQLFFFRNVMKHWKLHSQKSVVRGAFLQNRNERYLDISRFSLEYVMD